MVSLFGKRVVWSRETELSSLLLCLVMRAGEISLATRGGSERNLLPLFTLRNDRICSNFRAFPPRPSLALFVAYAVFTAVFTQLSWLRRSSLPLSLSLTLRRHHWLSWNPRSNTSCVTSDSTSQRSGLSAIAVSTTRRLSQVSQTVQKRCAPSLPTLASTSQTGEHLTSASTRKYSWLGSERKHRLRSKRVQKRSSVNMASR